MNVWQISGLLNKVIKPFRGRRSAIKTVFKQKTAGADEIVQRIVPRSPPAIHFVSFKDTTPSLVTNTGKD